MHRTCSQAVSLPAHSTATMGCVCSWRLRAGKKPGSILNIAVVLAYGIDPNMNSYTVFDVPSTRGCPPAFLYSGISKRGFSRYGISKFDGSICLEYVWVTGVQLRFGQTDSRHRTDPQQGGMGQQCRKQRVVREMVGAPRSPAPGNHLLVNHLLVWIVKPSGCH